jgi:type III pantothenate kinase
VADLGNTRLKWAMINDHGRAGPTAALPLDEEHAWADQIVRWGSPRLDWWASSVNPQAADRVETFLRARGDDVRWFRSAADVPIPHALTTPETTGADRALAVAAAVSEMGRGPGRVVMCGTGVTVERIDADGVWLGGAITAGFGLAARALHEMTAQLPLVEPPLVRIPPRWGSATRPALEAGVYWGVVGAVRVLLEDEEAAAPWIVWTGGDAEVLAAGVVGPGAQVEPDLVLRGLAALSRGD